MQNLLINLCQAILGMVIVTIVAIYVAPFIEEVRKEGR